MISSRIGTSMSSPSIENRLDALRIHWRQESPRFSGMPQPFTLLRHEDMRVVETARRAVDAPELFDGLVGSIGCVRRWPADQRCRERLQICVSDSVGSGGERRIAGRLRAKRIEPRGEMSVSADALREVRGTDNLANVEVTLRPCVARRLVRSGRPRLEHLAGLRVDRLRVLLIPLVQLEHIARVHAAELIQTHSIPS
jgi:hypothetical protein